MKLVTTGPIRVTGGSIMGFRWGRHDMAIIAAMCKFERMARQHSHAGVRKRAARNLANLQRRYPALAADLDMFKDYEKQGIEMEVPELMNAADAADYLHVGLEEFEHIVRSGCLKPITGVEGRMFLTSDLEDFISDCIRPQ